MKLTQKTILIISPNEWGIMYISKHHYAISLSKRNNKVFFLNPPKKDLTVKFQIEKLNEYPNLFIVTYRPIFNISLRFHVPLLYKALMYIQVLLIRRHLKEHFDIVWSFETNLYWNLKWFKGFKTIYHPVDQVAGKYQTKIEESSDFIFSVSENILNKFHRKKHKLLINHGLSEHFERIALINAKQDLSSKIIPPYKIGYIGNLFIYALDRKNFKRVIIHNSNIQFHIWSPLTIMESNVSGDTSKESIEFIDFLKKAPNVRLEGLTKTEKLSQEIQKMDGFLVCYDVKRDHNGGSNTHKVLEYLSTGKVVIASKILAYQNKPELILMVDENEELPDKVEKTVFNINYLNSQPLQLKRISFALENTYDNNLSKIENYMSLTLQANATN